MSQILALSMRPKQLQELVGQTNIQKLLESQKISGRIPHFYLIQGAPGCGKTTLARILALSLQVDNFNPDSNDWNLYEKYDILEVNGSNDNSIEFVRNLIEKNRYKPSFSSKVKVVIIDEAHQLSNSAQNAMLKETEDTGPMVFYIFCTSSPTKIIPALKRRACIINPDVLTNKGIELLVTKTSKKVRYSNVEDIEAIVKKLIENDIRLPGLILQIVERMYNGMSVEMSVLLHDTLSKLDTRILCQSVLKGNFKACIDLGIGGIDKSEIYGLKVCIIGYLKAVLVSKSCQKHLQISKAIVLLHDIGVSDNVGFFLAKLCLACTSLV